MISLFVANKTNQLDLVQIKQSIRVVSVKRLPGVSLRLYANGDDNKTVARPDWLTAMVDSGDPLPDRHMEIINEALARRESLLRRSSRSNSSMLTVDPTRVRVFTSRLHGVSSKGCQSIGEDVPDSSWITGFWRVERFAAGEP